MPVTTSKAVNQRLVEVLIQDGFSVIVVVEFAVEGIPPSRKSFTISQAEAMPYWLDNPTPGVNRMEDLAGLLYTILIARGDIEGTVS